MPAEVHAPSFGAAPPWAGLMRAYRACIRALEVREFAAKITAPPTFADDSPERANAVTTLRNISYVLARRDFVVTTS